MIKYAEKYPYPGPRPGADVAAPVLEGDRAGFLENYRKWRFQAQDMTQWQTRMRQHVVARALDAVVRDFQARAARIKGGVRGLPPLAGEPVPDRVELYPGEAAKIVIWLSYLQEPLPEELFP